MPGCKPKPQKIPSAPIQPCDDRIQVDPLPRAVACVVPVQMVRWIWRQSGLEFPVHSHLLRHATGYKLTNDGQDTRAI